MDKNFNLDSVKVYLDGVLAGEEHLNTYNLCALEVYRVNNFKPVITVKDVEIWLRGLPIGVDYLPEKTVPLARDFAKDIKSLTMGTRSEDDVFWWAVATGIWIFGAIDKCNPEYRGGN